MDDLINATCLAFGVQRDELLSPKRTDELAQARFAAMLVLRRRGYSFPRIAMILNRDDHTTVMHGVGRALYMERESGNYRDAVMFIDEHSRVEHESANLLGEMLNKGAGRPLWEPDSPIEVINAYEGGKSLLALATELGTGQSTLRKWFIRNGVNVIRGRNARKRQQDGRIPRIMEMRKEGATLEQIGEEFGITRERVRQLVVKAGLTKEFAERPPTPFEVQVFEEYKAGASIDFVASKLGICSATARSWLVKYGYEIRPSRKRLKQRAERDRLAAQIAERYHAGENTGDIAKAFGFSQPAQIYRYLALAGTKPTRGPSNKVPRKVVS